MEFPHGVPPWNVPVIETDRFRLRAYRDSDVERTIEVSNDELSLQWLSKIPQPFGRPEAERYIASRHEGLASGDRVTWVIADPASDELLGDVSVAGLLSGDSGELGYCAHPAARGRGLVTAAVGRVIEQAFLPVDQGGLGRRRLELVAARGNLASIKVAQSNGFTQTGVRRAADRRRDGSYEDLLTFDLLSEEHRAGRLPG
ncbi:GNAT family N-acetyltransferase [Kribbella sp. NPDC051620]|uniref:GNAT family N-acetyltransferase n=1 Tax=Kribbella sp. NPDC051620 TaxID=3364120 RepID=UPI0037BA1A31